MENVDYDARLHAVYVDGRTAHQYRARNELRSGRVELG
jgi:hypothetical protein